MEINGAMSLLGRNQRNRGWVAAFIHAQVRETSPGQLFADAKEYADGSIQLFLCFWVQFSCFSSWRF